MRRLIAPAALTLVLLAVGRPVPAHHSVLNYDGKVDRITSYNVCYTKLLRVHRFYHCGAASHRFNQPADLYSIFNRNPGHT